MSARIILISALLIAIAVPPSLAEGVLMSWSPRNLRGASPESLRSLHDRWNSWLAGERVEEYSTPFPASDKGLEEIRSLAALEALIVSLKPSKQKDKKTAECLRNLYHLAKLPTEPGAPGRLCSPDPWIYTYLGKLTDVTNDHDPAWWSKWWSENKSDLVWDSGPGRFAVRKATTTPN